VDELDRGGLSDSKRRLIDRLKHRETATAGELAAEFGLTDTAVRQHLETLEQLGLVARAVTRPAGRGRPPVHWRLSALASGLFPDRHGELTVELLDAVRQTFGDAGAEAVVAARTARQRDTYRQLLGHPLPGTPLPGTADDVPVVVRATRLAKIRASEGYLAEVTRDGETIVLTEHHCPIHDAAAACPGLCQGELELFRDVLGEDVIVERTSHLLAGDARCVYRLTPAARPAARS